MMEINPEPLVLVEVKKNLQLEDWGSIDPQITETSHSVAYVKIFSGKTTPCHLHKNKSEICYIVKGNGEARLGNKVREIKSGDVLHINPWEVHQIRAFYNLEILELQYGECSEKDIVNI